MVESQDSESVLYQQVAEALNNPQLPHIYFNGFVNSLGSGDLMMILQRNGQPVAVLNTSYTLAKTLAEKVHDLIASLEADTGNTIMITDDINEAVQRRQASQGDHEGSGNGNQG